MSRLIRGGVFFSLGILISRVLGYLRDALIAYNFGASHISDAFFIAFRLPNVFRRVFGEGGFNAVFIPLYGKALKEGRERDFLSKISGLVLLLSLVVSFLGSFFAESIVSVLAPGTRDRETFGYAVFFLRYVFPYLFLVSLYAFSMAVLMVRGYFFVPSVSQALFNGVLILSVAFLTERIGVFSLVAGVLVGGVFQNLPNVLLMVKEGLLFVPRLVLDSEVRDFLKRFSMTILSFSAGQLSAVVDTFLASFLRTGAISYMYYAGRLYLLPVSLFSVGISNSFLAVVSSGESKEKNLQGAVKFVILLTLPAATGLALMSESIVRFLYARGEFGEKDVFYTSVLLSLYALSVPFYSLQHPLRSYFYSLHDIRTPVRATFVNVLVDGLLASFFIFLLSWDVWSFPLATLFASIAGLLYLLRKLPVPPGLEKSFILKVLAACGVMGGLILLSGLHERPEGVLLIPLFALSYFLCLLALREETTLLAVRRAMSRYRRASGE